MRSGRLGHGKRRHAYRTWRSCGFAERNVRSVFLLGRFQARGDGQNQGGGGYRGIFVCAGVTRLGRCAFLAKLSASIQSCSWFEGVVKVLWFALTVER